MPTPGGLLRGGDILQHDSLPGVRFRVVERSGSSKVDYSVIVERTDGQVLPRSANRLPDNIKRMRITEAHYWVFMHRTGWHLVG